MTMGRPLKRVTIAVVVTVAVVACFKDPNKDEDDNQFRDDVLRCEDALSRLVKCCPGFDGSRVECNHLYRQESGCGSTTTTHVDPALTIDESRCIADTSCDA